MEPAPENGQTDPREQIHKLKSEFLASLNHEIRTPLSGILGMLDLLDESELSFEQREYVSSARMCAEDLLSSLNTALEYSALAVGQLKLEEAEFNLAECVRSAVEQHQARAQARGIALTVSLEGQFPGLVVADGMRVRDVLSHLVDNALKFTPRGSVSVTAQCTNGCAPLCLLATVRDTGIGIPADQFPAIFDSFHRIDSGFSRRYAGFGLGLALVQRLVDLMGGKVEVESRPGQGSEFRVRIPLKPAPDSPVASGSAGQSDNCILVVEDDELGRRIATHILRRAGYDIDTAADGPSAIAAARNRPYALILMDIEMPGIGGIETMRAIRMLPGRDPVPVLALTAHVGAEYRDECLAQGMQGFLTKPVRPQDLLAAVRHVIGPAAVRADAATLEANAPTISALSA